MNICRIIQGSTKYLNGSLFVIQYSYCTVSAPPPPCSLYTRNKLKYQLHQFLTISFDFLNEVLKWKTQKQHIPLVCIFTAVTSRICFVIFFTFGSKYKVLNVVMAKRKTTGLQQTYLFVICSLSPKFWTSFCYSLEIPLL